MADVQLVILLTSVALVVIGLYSAIFIDNIIKKIIGISFIEEGGYFMVRFKRSISSAIRFGAYQYRNRRKYTGSHACFSNGFIQTIWHIIYKSNVS